MHLEEKCEHCRQECNSFHPFFGEKLHVFCSVDCWKDYIKRKK